MVVSRRVHQRRSANEASGVHIFTGLQRTLERGMISVRCGNHECRQPLFDGHALSLVFRHWLWRWTLAAGIEKCLSRDDGDRYQQKDDDDASLADLIRELLANEAADYTRDKCQDDNRCADL